MKKVLSTLFILALALVLVLALPTRADAAIVDSGSCGDFATWELDDQGTLTISGSGEVYGNMWTIEGVKKVVIGDEITIIGSNTFYGCTTVTSVELGSRLVEIGESAFAQCTALESVVIPDSVTRIGHFAFQNCEKLTSVTLGNNVEFIGTQAFYSAAFEEIELPETLTFLGESAFSECKNLIEVSIHDGVEMQDYVFSSCTSLVSVRLPETLKELPGSTFSNCHALKSVKLPDSITRIGSYALASCYSLEEIIFGDNVTEIGDGAFSFCHNLRRVSLPGGLDSIGYGVFSGLNGSLEVLYFRGTPEQWANVTIGEDNGEIPANDEIFFAAPENLTGIKVSQLPKYIYYVGEELDLNDLRLTGTCSDGSTVDLISMHLTSISSVDMSTVGKKTITVYIGGLSTSFNVGVHTGGPQLIDSSLYPSIITDGGVYVPEKVFTWPNAREINIVFGEDSNEYEDFSGYIQDFVGNQINLYHSTPDGYDYFPGKTFTIPGSTFKLGAFKPISPVRLVPSTIHATVIDHQISGDRCSICGIHDPAKFIDGGNLTDDVQWALGVDGTLTISGNGAIPDFDIDEYYRCTTPWYVYTYQGTITSIVIEEGVTHIGAYAFDNCGNVTTLTIPSTLKYIGTAAMRSLGSIKTIFYNGTDADYQQIEVAEENYCFYYGITCYNPSTNLTDITLSCPPNKTSYYVGDTLDLTGLQLFIIRSDGTGFTGAMEYVDNISDVDMSTPGIKTVTLTCRGYEVSFPIYVHEVTTETLDPETYPESAHNYANDLDDEQTFTYEGATELILTFSEDTLLERGYDFLEIYDQDGNQVPIDQDELPGLTVVVPGDSFKVRMTSDDSIVSYGYSFSSIVAKTIKHTMKDGHCTVCGYYNPDDFVASGQCGDNSYWTLDENGTLIIFGFGDTQNWGGYSEYYVKNVIVEEGITSIANSLFSGCASLESVSLPSTLQSITHYAFGECTALTEITIPDSVTYMESYAFYRCTSLTTVTIGSGLKELEYSTFGACEKLETISFSEGLTRIGSNAFYGCISLKNVSFPNSLTEISSEAFRGCSNLKDVNFGTGLTKIDTYAFAETAIEELTLPEGLVSIETHAFHTCTSLRTVCIPESLTYIGTWAFENCGKLSSVIYSGTQENWNSLVIDFGNNNLTDAVLYFAAPEDIASLSVSSKPTNTAYVKGDTLNLDGLTLIATRENGAQVPLTDWHVTNFTVDMSKTGKQTVTVYVGEASATFEIGIHEGSVTEYTTDLPESSHPYEPGTNTQEFTSNGASELILTFAEGSQTEENYDYIYIYDKNDSVVAQLCGNLSGKIVTVPGDYVKIIMRADDSEFFYGYAFSSIVAKNITHTYEDGFCTICGTHDPDVYHGLGSFNKINWQLTTDGVLKISGSGDITSAPWTAYNSYITSIVIEDGITGIGSSAFNGCANLTEVSIPSSVTNIEEYAFANCTSLENVMIPESVTSIGESAFQGCSAITELNIPNSVTELVYGAFRDCTSLQTVTLPSSLTKIDSTLFMNCTSLETISLPDSVNRIEWAAFQGCNSLTTISIPHSVYTIGEDAFRDCANLTTVSFVMAPQYIFRSTFEGCTKLVFNEYDNGLYLGDLGSKYSIFYAMKDDQSTTCTVHDDTMVIAGSAFSKSMLTSVKLPDGLTSINPKAFHDCFYLTDVYIPDSVNYIGRSAFSGCERLKSITLPSQIRTIYEWTFYNCSALQTVTIPGNVISIGGYAFNLCAGLQEVIIKSGVTTIDYDAFSQCYSLKRVVLPLSVDYIGYSAFYDCGALDSVLYAGTEQQRNDIFSEGPNDQLFDATWYYGCSENSTATVTFMVDDKVISSKTYTIGDTITVPGSPTKASDNTYSYSFTGWDKEVSTTCQGDATYTATFKATKRTYTITFKNEDGSVISKKTYNYGATITVPANPTKASTNTYKYSFAGWGKTVSKTCKGNATYTASFTATKRTYTVTFKDADGTELSKKTYNYGATITVPANPTKASTNTYKYTFAGWDKDVSKTCKGNATYTATYTSAKRTYTVTFKNEDGKTITSKTYNYGATITVPANPTKASTNTYKYTFAGWDKDVSKTCKGNATYTATFKATKRTYTVTFKNADGTTISSKSYTYGATVTVPKATMSSSTYVYTFKSWDKTVSTTCKGSATYTASYSKALHTPSVSASNNSSGDPVLKWSAVKNAYKYEIYRATSANGTYKKIATTSKTSYTDTDAKTGKTYYYKVRTTSNKSGVDKSAFCASLKIATKLKTPTIKVTHKQNDRQNVVKWSKISGAKKYVLQVSVNGGAYKTLTTTTKTSYTHKKIVGGRTYTYRLIAKASASAYDSAYSKTVKIAAKCARPAVTVKLNSSDKPVLKWNDVAGAQKYQIYVANTKTGTYKLLTTTTKETYTHKKAVEGKTYYYKVRAIDSKGVKGSFSVIDRIVVK